MIDPGALRDLVRGDPDLVPDAPGIDLYPATPQDIWHSQYGLQGVPLRSAGRRYVSRFVAGPAGEVENLLDHIRSQARTIVLDHQLAAIES